MASKQIVNVYYIKWGYTAHEQPNPQGIQDSENRI